MLTHICFSLVTNYSSAEFVPLVNARYASINFLLCDQGDEVNSNTCTPHPHYLRRQ